MQNKPNLLDAQMNISSVLTKYYENVTLRRRAENKPRQTQFKTSPAVCGLFRPVILVPQDLAPIFGASHLRAVLMHELAHIKRGDLWVNLAQTLLQIIYFYSPFVWLGNAIIRRVREHAVDEATLVAMGDNAQKQELEESRVIKNRVFVQTFSKAASEKKILDSSR